MSCQTKKRFFSGAVRDEEELSPPNIDSDSDSSDGKGDDDSNAQPQSSVQATSEYLLGRDGTLWKCFNPVSSGRA